VSLQPIRTAVRGADALLQWLGGAVPTLIVLTVLVMSGVPPYGAVLSDLLNLLRLLIR
jgi:hypothetical protein